MRQIQLQALCCSDADAAPVCWWDGWGPSQPIRHASSHRDAQPGMVEEGLLMQDQGTGEKIHLNALIPSVSRPFPQVCSLPDPQGLITPYKRCLVSCRWGPWTTASQTCAVTPAPKHHKIPPAQFVSCSRLQAIS